MLSKSSRKLTVSPSKKPTFSFSRKPASKPLLNSQKKVASEEVVTVRSLAFVGSVIQPLTEEQLRSETLEVHKLLMKYGFAVEK